MLTAGRPTGMDPRKRSGARVRELRRRADLTQQQLGERAAVSYKFVGGIERGEENPSLEVILKIAEGLGVEPGDLFETGHLLEAKELKKAARQLLDEAAPDDLRRVVKVVRALVR